VGGRRQGGFPGSIGAAPVFCCEIPFPPPNAQEVGFGPLTLTVPAILPPFAETYPGGSGIDSLRQILLARRSQHDEERLQRGPSAGSPKVLRASSNHIEFLSRFGGQSAQGFLSSVLKNKGNRLAEVRQAFFPRFALTVGTRHFGAVCEVPWAVLLDDRRELVAHV
jgi:hypothetical protein